MVNITENMSNSKHT